mmetsp:Transcript_30324/g.61926  ORF Transcript_30324/g.61926 Transcript_30324/m.61926 type:complete len:743 (+) Transcript_30324:153-2381(+)
MTNSSSSTPAILNDRPQTQIRLFLRASNLPKSMTARGYRQPDTLARVAILTPDHRRNEYSEGAADNTEAAFPPLDATFSSDNSSRENLTFDEASHSCCEPSQLKTRHDQVMDQTEIVCKCSNPRWTASFCAKYEYGSQLIFFVEVFAIKRIKGDTPNGKNGVEIEKSNTRSLGKAAFDVQDVLGSKNHVKARRLPKGGVIYAQIEQLHGSNSFFSSTQQHHPPSPKLRRTLGPTPYSGSKSRVLTLQLRASSLIHTHSIQNRIVPTTIAKPDTYFEISRPSFRSTPEGDIRNVGSHSSSWVVVYRSPAVKESDSPTWDEAVINLDSLYSASSSTLPSSISPSFQDLRSYSLLITVFKAKRKKCKEIGSFQTTILSLIEAYENSRAAVKVTGYEENEEGIHHQNNHSATDTKSTEFTLQHASVRGPSSSCEITGKVSVVTARVENTEDVWNRSRQFASCDDDADSDAEAMDDSLEEIESRGNDSSISSVTMSTVVPDIPRRPKNAKFTDYASSGLDIDLCVAIDFTSSNGNPREPGTLHFSMEGMMNDYEEAIKAIGTTISKYSLSKRFPVWGFGAKYDGMVRHIFQCGNAPEANGVEGVLDAYRSVFESDFIMSGPTVIDLVIKKAASRSKRFHAAASQSSKKYCILLVLTDGMVSDLASTKNLVRAFRGLPLSVVVVGIGRADFTEMQQWSDVADIQERGRFTFVEFRELQFDSKALSRKALEKVPHEVVGYFLDRDILPS